MPQPFQTPEPKNEVVRNYAPGSPEKKSLKLALARVQEAVESIPLRLGAQKTHSGGRSINVCCPHDHKRVLAKGTVANSSQVQEAIDAALKARPAWAATPFRDRAAIFLRAAELLATRYRDEMNAATMLGQSKTVYQAEIDSACELIDFWRFNVRFAEEIAHIQPLSTEVSKNRLEPRGLEGFVLSVTPFNFTSIALNLPTAPALMGCVSVWKPALTSLWSSHVGMKILEEAGLPAGVINFIPCEHDAINDLVLKHPALSGLHFTGSTATFNHFWKTIGANIDRYHSYPRLVGETGGKDFVFAHASADVETLAVALLRGAFEYQGQKCSAASRAYVPRTLWQKLRPLLVDMVQGIAVGDPEDFKNFMGAVIDARSFKKIKNYIDGAKSSSDAKVIAGGDCDDSVGYFIRPTIIETQNPKYQTMVEEIFGPVLTVYVYEEQKFEETLDLCDSTSPYALTGAIFAQDNAILQKMNARLVNAAGNFYINDKPTGAVVGQQPFGGARQSGTNDKAGSILNLLRWTSMRTVKENLGEFRDYRYPFMGES